MFSHSLVASLTLATSLTPLYANPLNALSGLVPTINTVPDVQISGPRSGFSLEAVAVPASNESLIARRGSRGNAGDPTAIDRDWFIAIKVGTPAQTILVQPDAGAPDFSLMSTLIPVKMRGDAPVYDPKKSSTVAVVKGLTWSESYSGGAYKYTGIVVTDVVKVGSITFENFAFEVCETSKTQVGGAPYGTFGLNIEPNGQPTTPTRIPSWFPAVMDYLFQPVFTVDWHKSTSRGTIDFGFINTTQYTGDIGYAPVVSDNAGQWVINLQGFAVGSKYYATPFRVWVDTGGVSAMYFPRWAIDAYFKQIPGAVWNATWNSYSFPCSTKLVDVVFGTPDNVKLRIPGANIPGLGAVDVQKQLCISDLIASDSKTIIWAKAMIENFLVVFDYGNKRLGFAQKTSY